MKSFVVPSRRRGVTLMEVLISIFVLSIGMLGVAALIPVGRWTLVETGKADRAGACGRAAMREVKARRMLYGLGQLNTGSLDYRDTSWYRWQFVNTSYRTGNYQSFCIDPLGVARLNSVGANTTQTDRFPCRGMNTSDSSLYFSMPRLTLYLPATSSTTMSLAAAERIFRATDDLDFFLPPDRGVRPRPKVMFDNGVLTPYPRNTRALPAEPSVNNSLPVAVMSEGRYSWMLTLTPQYSVALGGTILPPDQVPYNVTVVVFYDRSFTPPETSQETPSERVLTIPEGGLASLGLGLGGGRVPLEASRRGWLELEPNQYIMLAGRTSNPAMSRFCWYRVAMAGEISNPSTGRYRRYVSLEGPDWPRLANTRAVIVTGVIGAYTMPLEREYNPLWVR